MSKKFKENPEVETDLISLRKATKYCDYSGDYLKLRARQGKLKAVKIGRMWATKKEWVQDYIRKMEGYKESAKIGTDLISLTKATKYCGYSGDYLKLRARRGKLKAVKIGRVWATKKEWVEDYVREMEEYKENRRRQGEVKLDVKEREAKEVEPVRRIPSFPKFKLKPAPALALTLILLLLFSSIVLGKESLRTILKHTIFYVQQIPKTINHVLKESKKSLASSLDSLNQTFINVAEVIKTTDYQDLKEPIPLFKEYFKWLGNSLKTVFVQKPKALVRDILNYGSYLSKKIRKGFKNLVFKFQEFITRLFKPRIVEKPPEKPILVEVTREEFEKLKQEIERIKEEGLPVKEITKEIQVSKITRIEPIKEITKEIKTLDDESLKIIRATLSQQETDVEKLKLAAKFGYVNVIFPTTLPLEGDTTIITLGTISTGTWNGDVITTTYGGTGANLSTGAQGGLLYMGASSIMGISAAGTSGYALISGGTGVPTWTNTPSWSTLTLSTSATSPIYTGTGAVTLSSGGAEALTLDSASGTVQIATGDSLTVPGTITVDGQLVATKAPTEAHTGTWSVDSATWHPDDATIYINPSSATGDSNLLGLAVNGFVKFAIDAEGDIFGRNLILEGSTSAATTTITGDLRVEGSTTLGDTSTDTLTFNASTLAIANNLNIDSDTLFIDASGNMVGIGTTGPNAKLEISPADANALRIGPFGAVAGNTGEIQLLELTANGTNYVGFKAPDTITSNVIWTLPSVVGTSDYALTTDGTGTLSWSQAGVNDATYLTLTYHDDLTAERVLTQGTNISITDGGANSTLTLATIVNPTFSTSVTSPIIYGSSAASGSLTLRSTSDVTKGYVLLADDGGDVGIGATPSYKLDVSGDINFTGKLREDGTEILSGVIAAFAGSCPTGWTEYTAARGRTIVGTPLAGTNEGIVGTALSNLGTRTITDVASHRHSVDPPITGTSTAGAHSHGQTVDDYSNSTSFNYFVTGPDPRGTKHTSTAGAHTHTVNIAPFNSAYTGVASVDVTMPYIQLTYCQKSAGADLAEWIPVSEDISAETIVSIDPNNREKIIAARKSYDPTVVGIISSTPGWLIGEEKSESVHMALAGRVPTRVSLINGEIKPGDPITTSSIPGVGMKATKSGPIVGKAMEALNETSSLINCYNSTTGINEKCGTVLVFVNISWFNPENSQFQRDTILAKSSDAYYELLRFGDDLTDGDLVSLEYGEAPNQKDPTKLETVSYISKTRDYSSKTYVGVISNTIGGQGDLLRRERVNNQIISETRLVFTGNTKVKISPSSEPIQLGDFLSSSDEAGMAKKVTKAGLIIGKALESWTPGSNKDKIMVFVNLGWYDPDVYLTSTEDIKILRNEEIVSDSSISRFLNFQLADIVGNQINRIGIFSEAVVANLKVGKLEVEGNASKTTAGDWLANSDIRIMTEIQDLDNALDIINSLRPVKFRYTDKYRTKHDSVEDRYYYNFIAQGFQEVFPDSVKEEGIGYTEEAYLLLDTYNVRPYLVAAVQELSREVEELKLNSQGIIGSGESIESTDLGTVDTFIQEVKQALANLGFFIENGIAKVKKLIAEVVQLDKLEIRDQTTGEIYCTWIENGEWVKVKGECNAIDTSGGTGSGSGSSGGGCQSQNFYYDGDGDGYGTGANFVQECQAPAGYVPNYDDCDDTNSEINPVATEICDDGIDNDCDGKIDAEDEDCQVTPSEPVCDSEHLDLCTTKELCEEAGLYWYDETCNLELENIPADADGDGVVDSEDACPDTAGDFCRGCPQPECSGCQKTTCPESGTPICQDDDSLCGAPNTTGVCQDGTCNFTCADGYQKDDAGICQPIELPTK